MNGVAIVCLVFGLLAGYSIAHVIRSIKVQNAITEIEQGFENALDHATGYTGGIESAVQAKLRTDTAAVKNAFYMLRAKL